MKFRRAGGDARIAARAAAALALDMNQTVAVIPVTDTETGIPVSGTESSGLEPAQEGSDAAIDVVTDPAPEDTPQEDPPASEDEPAALLLAGGYFRIRELYKPGTARLRSQEPRQLFKGKQ